MKKWTIEDSKELYNINGWGTSYFGINEKGDVYVTPCKNDTQIDLRNWPYVMSRHPYCFASPTSWTIGLKRPGVVLRKLLKSTTTKEKTMWSIQLR